MGASTHPSTREETSADLLSDASGSSVTSGSPPHATIALTEVGAITTSETDSAARWSRRRQWLNFLFLRSFFLCVFRRRRRKRQLAAAPLASRMLHFASPVVQYSPSREPITAFRHPTFLYKSVQSPASPPTDSIYSYSPRPSSPSFSIDR